MFNILISEHIKARKEEKGLTYETISAKAPVPLSTLHAYAQGTVKTPKDDVLVRIFAVLGDGPEVVQQLRKKAAASTAEESQLLSASTDQERMEAFASLMRANMSAVLEEYRLQAAAQQTEIIQNADKRVEEAKTEASNQCSKVAEQCRIHEQEYKDHCNALLDAERRASAAELKGSTDIIQLLERNIVYLRTLVRNLSLVSGLLGAYSFYAYKTFDVADPSRGLYQGGFASNTLLIIMLVALLFVLLSIGKTFFSWKIFGSKQEQTPKTSESKEEIV